MITTKIRPPITSGHRCVPSPVSRLKLPSSQPMGNRHSRLIKLTMPIGMSSSVRGNNAPCPVLRARDEASAEVRPSITGLTSLARVQIAATPMVPAPMKRTFSFHAACAISAAAPTPAASIV